MGRSRWAVAVVMALAATALLATVAIQNMEVSWRKNLGEGRRWSTEETGMLWGSCVAPQEGEYAAVDAAAALGIGLSFGSCHTPLLAVDL